MPRFTLTSQDEDTGLLVTVTFTSDFLPEVNERFDQFLRASDFDLPYNEDGFERRITQEDFVAKEEDYLWDDAIKSKFSSDNVVNLQSFTLGHK